MLFWVEQEFVGKNEIQNTSSLKTPAWEPRTPPVSTHFFSFYFFSFFLTISKCIPYGINESIFENGGYCKRIIDHQPVNGTMIQLQRKEQKMRELETFMSKAKKNILWKMFGPRQSCLDQIDKIFCHHYFQSCYTDSTVQRVCREACEELKSKYCNPELNLAKLYNILPESLTSEIMDCTDLPSLKESSICYHPDKIRGW